MVAAATPQRVGPASAGRLRQLGICAFVGRTGISARPNALELAAFYDLPNFNPHNRGNIRAGA